MPIIIFRAISFKKVVDIVVMGTARLFSALVVLKLKQKSSIIIHLASYVDALDLVTDAPRRIVSSCVACLNAARQRGCHSHQIHPDRAASINLVLATHLIILDCQEI